MCQHFLRGITKNINIDDIEYFEVAHAVITVHYEEDESFEFYSTMDKITEKLFGKNFVRPHRSFLVNLGKVKEKQDGKLLMQSGTLVPIARGKNEEVDQELKRVHKI